MENDQLNVCVEDFWEEGRGWKWEDFSDFLLPSLLMKLASITSEATGQTDDQIGQLKLGNSKFTVASAYMLLAGVNNKGRWSGRLKIWHLKVQRRTKLFIWLLAHDRILTNMSRRRKGLVTSPTCSRCTDEDENSLHTVRACLASKKVWILCSPCSSC